MHLAQLVVPFIKLATPTKFHTPNINNVTRNLMRALLVLIPSDRGTRPVMLIRGISGVKVPQDLPYPRFRTPTDYAFYDITLDFIKCHFPSLVLVIVMVDYLVCGSMHRNVLL